MKKVFHTISIILRGAASSLAFLGRPVFTRAFVALYALGIVSSIVTVPKGAKMYEDAPWELFVDVYAICLVLWALRYAERRMPCPAKPMQSAAPTVCNRSKSPSRARIAHMLHSTLKVLNRALKAAVYVFAYAIYIIDTFCFVQFGSTITPSMLLLMGETNGNEASEFFHVYMTWDLLQSDVGWMLLILLVHIIVAVTWFYAKRLWRRKGAVLAVPLRRIRAFTLPLFGAAAAYFFCYSLGICYDNKQMFVKVMQFETVGAVEHEMSTTPHVTLYQPTYRLAFSVYCNRLASQQLGRLQASVGSAHVDSCSVKSPHIVLIINESANKRRAQIYGGDKDNMPCQVRLMRHGELVKMEDAVAPWNLTSFVFKHLMTTYCVGDTADWCDYPLFCEMFRESGYTVSFFTNQFLSRAKEAVYDFSGGFFINNPELSRAQFDIRNDALHAYDEGLLTDYEQSYVPHAIDSGRPTLTIFHLMGMHVDYRLRYPKDRKHWNADSYPDDSDLKEHERNVLADYDNAVLYNDSVINQIIERFKDKEAIVVCLSDHGEEVFGPNNRHFFCRMHKTEVTRPLADEEFRVPMWLYCSPLYARRHPDVVAAIRTASRKPYMTDALSHLLLGLAGIHSPHYRSSLDLLSPAYDATRKRMIKRTIDYDALK